jgi:hypothetical protein
MGYQIETLVSKSVVVHPQWSHNGFPMDGALMGAGSLRQTCSSHVAPANNLIEFSENPTFSAKILKL